VTTPNNKTWVLFLTLHVMEAWEYLVEGLGQEDLAQELLLRKVRPLLDPNTIQNMGFVSCVARYGSPGIARRGAWTRGPCTGGVASWWMVLSIGIQEWSEVTSYLAFTNERGHRTGLQKASKLSIVEVGRGTLGWFGILSGSLDLVASLSETCTRDLGEWRGVWSDKRTVWNWDERGSR